ncbi:MAG: MBL fold metallo-hydrolase [Phocaeicola sp.]
MEKITFLGTGNAAVTSCYNSCFTLSQGDEHLLVDGGGGNGILIQLEKAGISYQQIHHLVVSHAHTDHLFGAIWVIRMIGAEIGKGKYKGNLHLYVHKELAELISQIIKNTLPQKIFKLLGERILIEVISDGECKDIMNHQVTFFDIHSTKLKQFGFTLIYGEANRFTFLGDEPYNEQEYEYVKGADWLLHEAFCLYSERERFKPYEKHHATVKEACEVAQQLGVKNLLLFHTEDKCIADRKSLYSEEGSAYYSGNLFVPNDLEILEL